MNKSVKKLFVCISTDIFKRHVSVRISKFPTAVVVLVVDHASQGMWAGLNLALSAANLADVSGDTLRKDAVAEVYVLAAMTIRFYFPSQLHFLAVSIARR